MVLIELLNREFKLYGIEKFIHPPYYSFPIGLRFKLGIAAIKYIDQYIDEVVQRICTIFSTAFAPEDKILLVFDTTPRQRVKKHIVLLWEVIIICDSILAKVTDCFMGA